jgi:tripartite-type tricarboxylate transporter receptor subunit TctC
MSTRLSRRLVIAVGSALALGAALPLAAHASDWPKKPVTLIVPWGAGGGTDATARMIATLLEKELGVPVPVVNRTGGSGVVGHAAIASAAPDGHTIGVATLEIGSMHYQGLTTLTYESYAPIGVYNADPAALFVRTDSPYKTAKDAVEAIRAGAPRAFKASGSAQGGVNHLALAGMLMVSGIRPDQVAWVPSEGAAPGLQDLAAGGVNFAIPSLPEAQALIDAGRIRAVAIFADKRNATKPELPTFNESTGKPWTMGSWRGLVAPKGTPPAVLETLQKAVAKVVTDPAYLKFMDSRGYATQWNPGAEFVAFMKKSDADVGSTLRAVGIAK